MERLIGLSFVLLAASLGYSAEVYAKGRDRRPLQSTLGGHLLWGECVLEYDPQVQPQKVWPALCVKSRASSQVLLREDNGSENRLLNYAHVYTGLHLYEWISLHGEWYRSRFFQLAPKKDEAQYVDNKDSGNVFMQLGNVALNQWRFAAGKLDLPFGIDYRPLMEIYDESMKDRKYWSAPRYSARLTYDTQISSHYDIGYASEEIPGRKKSKEEKDELSQKEKEELSDRAMSVRMMFDISALEGFRFVFSGYGSALGERRVSAGFVTVNDNGDTGAFEWIRIRYTPDGLSEPFDQLFRLSYASAFYSGTRTVVEYEDTRFSYRLGTLGFDLQLPDYGLFRFAVSYHDQVLANEQDFWAFAAGMQLSL